MSITREVVILLKTVFVVIVCSGYMFAQANNTYVDPTNGNDANSCASTMQPCKTILAALVKTKTGGIVNLIVAGQYDPRTNTCSNSYDPVTVNKSITISALLPSKPCFNVGADNGIVILAADHGSIKVKLSGLHFIGRGYIGVSVPNGSGAADVTVDNCEFQSLNHGITFGAVGILTVNSSTIRAGTGVRLDVDTAGTKRQRKAIITSTYFYGHNNSALEANENGIATVKNSNFEGETNSSMDLAFKVNGDGKITVATSVIKNVVQVFEVGVNSAGSIDLQNCEITDASQTFRGSFKTMYISNKRN